MDVIPSATLRSSPNRRQARFVAQRVSVISHVAFDRLTADRACPCCRPVNQSGEATPRIQRIALSRNIFLRIGSGKPRSPEK